ncbi:MAG: exo-alpha-sialidase [Chromatiales bacterium]|nr:MAG: exo-alpha-sialidase [Chromatiales bacterium]
MRQSLRVVIASLAVFVATDIAIGGRAAMAGPALAFGESLAISAPDGRAMGPDIAVGTDGVIHVLWIDKAPPPDEGSAEDAAAGHTHTATDQLWYRRSVGPATAGRIGALSSPARVNSRDGEVWGFAVNKPVLDLDGRGNVHVFFAANDTNEKTGKGLLVARYTRSTDGGASFEPGRTLNSTATNDLSAVMHGGFAAAHAFGTLLVDGDDVQAFWIDTRDMIETDTTSAAWRAVSRDGGQTFTPDHAVYANDVCPCCQLSATKSGDAVLLASRMTYPGGFRDSAVGPVSAASNRFEPSVRVGEGQWKIDGCPLKRTAIAAADRNVYTAAYTGGRDPAGVYFSRSVDGGQIFQPAILMHPGAAVSDAPTVASMSDGTVIVAWHGKAGGGRRVYLRGSTDGGVTFSPVTELPAPDGIAAYPELDIAPDGSAWLAWQQEQVAYVVRVTVSSTPDAVVAGSRLP